jgi:hypothetical protein
MGSKPELEPQNTHTLVSVFVFDMGTTVMQEIIADRLPA